MSLADVKPYEIERADLYERRRWWFGMTLGDMFDKACDIYPDKEALVGEDKRYTYQQLRRLVENMAYNLLQEGFKKGDTVLLQAPNWPEFVISYFALQKAGLVLVLLTINHTAREIAHLADLTQPKGWILPGRYRKTDFMPIIEKVRDQNVDLEKIILLREKKRQGFLNFDNLVETDADRENIQSVLAKARPDPRDVCQILPSGGTTGLPKGAPRTHNDYICNLEYLAKAWDVNSTDKILVASTVGHNLALVACVTPSVFHGATLVLLDSTYPEDFCKVVQKEKITCTGLVPTLISRIVNHGDLDQYDLSSMQRIYVGASNSPPELVRKVEQNIGARYINAFGMVEGPLAQSRPYDSPEVRQQTIGRPCCPYEDFVTLNAFAEINPRGVEGELAGRGPGIFTGYLKHPQANQESFTSDGYFRTGDLAVIDEQGYIRITGRIKDIIIRGGENIAARDVEDLISSHPKVEYIAAVGMPDKDLGEQVCAYVKLVSGERVDDQELIEYLIKLEAAKHLIPARFEFLDKIPLTAAGKADKKILRKDIEDKLRNEA
ncbi:AMP-binding protein [Desulfosarcina ovata]|uniref:2,3-dihydroxybenzoate-AMP ligase n=2 Tax=Desulfosarcina ovata TaxID=83564 RepID=A0A5K8AMU7_9BACT|nr:class I adenylate-forming enzyme family protein [Desulfosarcina ovata]BBO85986.1 2,3-dihydroxybenzoate-AMP ligase [Desulfosarcina ovata subsp. sediminis]BBO92944.1 2,3-dihydroxybenzoate-AMP ligase [Desulfosarcina ovata subsp. ovata]